MQRGLLGDGDVARYRAQFLLPESRMSPFGELPEGPPPGEVARKLAVLGVRTAPWEGLQAGLLGAPSAVGDCAFGAGAVGDGTGLTCERKPVPPIGVREGKEESFRSW